MTHGSLFSGIGGFDLAADWMGWENKFHCEWNEFGQKILKHYWPNAKSYGDITKTDFTIWRGKIDVLTGGFPCQPYSTAGKRLGKEDDRHLWPEMLRAIREIQPRWVIGENVYGLVNWSGGMVFHEVQTEMEIEGYEIFPYVLPASGVGAFHRRERVWFVAYNDSFRFNRSECKNEINTSERGEYALNDTGKIFNATNSNKGKLIPIVTENCNNKTIGFNPSLRRESWDSFELVSGVGDSPTYFTEGTNYQPSIIRVDDGLSGELDELEAYGNAIVPQVALQLFKTIEQFEKTLK